MRAPQVVNTDGSDKNPARPATATRAGRDHRTGPAPAGLAFLFLDRRRLRIEAPMVWVWIGFILLILLLLALDLGVLNRKAHVIGVKEALKWSAFWIALGLLFSVFVYFGYDNHWLGLGRDASGAVAVDPIDGTPMEGHHATVKYLTGYVIEKSLSVDNIFVIALIFAYFAVPAIYQHRVLFWGILGALMMRGVMIWLGAELIH